MIYRWLGSGSTSFLLSSLRALNISLLSKSVPFCVYILPRIRNSIKSSPPLTVGNEAEIENVLAGYASPLGK